MYEQSKALSAYLNSIGKYKLLDKEEEFELARRIRTEGDIEALDTLVKSNTRFVVSIANKFPSNNGDDLLNNISFGNIGLAEAATRFDERRGFRFISYAVWWIRQSIIRGYLEESREIRIPINKHAKLRQIKRHIEDTDSMGTYEAYIELEKLVEQEIISEEDKEVYIAHRLANVNLDSPIDESNPKSRSYGESLADEDENFATFNTNEEVYTYLDNANLTRRERKIIDEYFGLGTDKTKTLEELGQEIGLTRERVRQVREIALNKIRIRNKIRL